MQKTEAQRKKEAQRVQYPDTKEEKEEEAEALAILADEKEEEEALQEEEALAIFLKENEQEVLQDGYEVEVTQQGQRLRRRSSRFESRPLF